MAAKSTAQFRYPPCRSNESLTVARDSPVSLSVLELVSQITAEVHVCHAVSVTGRPTNLAELTGEHPGELVRVLKARQILQFGDHTGLAVVGGRNLVNETLSQLFLIELLENILVVDEFEYDHLRPIIISVSHGLGDVRTA